MFLTIEHKEREFVPKILLSRFLIKSGYRVYLGSSEAVAILAHEARPGIFFHKSTHPFSPTFRSLGHRFVFLDEEGGITTPRSSIEDFCLWRYKTVGKDRQDLVLLPSKKFFDVVSGMENTRGVGLAVTGWPRIDLWRQEFAALYKTEASAITNQYGTFHLLVSSFGATDEPGFEHLISNESPTENFKSISEHKRQSFYNYMRLIKELSPKLHEGEKLIIRPHPSESISGWKNLVKGLPNVLVVRDGDITPWIIASTGVIHFGSTSVTQTVLLGKPAMSFGVTEKLGVTDSPSFELIPNVEDVQDALSILRGTKGPVIHAAELSREKLGALRDFMEVDPNEYACKKIVAQLDKLQVDPSPKSKLRIGAWLQIATLHLGSGLRAYLNKIGLRRVRLKTIVENLPGGIRKHEVASYLKRLDEIMGLKGNWEVQEIAPYLVVMEKAEQVNSK